MGKSYRAIGSSMATASETNSRTDARERKLINLCLSKEGRSDCRTLISSIFSSHEPDAHVQSLSC